MKGACRLFKSGFSLPLAKNSGRRGFKPTCEYNIALRVFTQSRRSPDRWTIIATGSLIVG